MNVGEKFKYHVIKIIFEILNMLYNIFVIMNMINLSSDVNLSRIFRVISTPVRFQILVVIGKGEACVCHIESLLDLCQAYISQQLMEMRDANLVETRREGRYIFYRLKEPQFLDLLVDISKLFGIPTIEMEDLLNTDLLSQCCCPNCHP